MIALDKIDAGLSERFSATKKYVLIFSITYTEPQSHYSQIFF